MQYIFQRVYEDLQYGGVPEVGQRYQVTRLNDTRFFSFDVFGHVC